MRHTRWIAVVVALAASSGCAAQNTARPAAPASADSTALAALPFDHVIVAIDSLDRGMALFESATGVRPIEGGAHAGRGLRNALVSLGTGRYLELIAPNPADSAAAARVANMARFRAPTPIGWAIHVSDARAERARLVAAGLHPGPVVAASRKTPGGQVLHWVTLVPFGRLPGAPFVISWDPASEHPSVAAPRGCTLAGLRIVSPAADSLRTLLARAGWPMKVAATPAGTGPPLQLALDCPKGRVRFP